MGCVLCNITSCEHLGTEAKPEPNPFFCRTKQERKEFLDELAYDIASRHLGLVKKINQYVEKLK